MYSDEINEKQITVADGINFVDLASIALFSQLELSTRSGKRLDKIDYALVSLMYKFLKSSFGQNGSHERDRPRRQSELSNKVDIPQPINLRRKLHVRVFLKFFLVLLNLKKMLHIA